MASFASIVAMAGGMSTLMPSRNYRESKNWKETQTKEDRNEKLEKAQAKRERKARKRLENEQR